MKSHHTSRYRRLSMHQSVSRTSHGMLWRYVDCWGRTPHPPSLRSRRPTTWTSLPSPQAIEIGDASFPANPSALLRTSFPPTFCSSCLYYDNTGDLVVRWTSSVVRPAPRPKRTPQCCRHRASAEIHSMGKAHGLGGPGRGVPLLPLAFYGLGHPFAGTWSFFFARSIVEWEGEETTRLTRKNTAGAAPRWHWGRGVWPTRVRAGRGPNGERSAGTIGRRREGPIVLPYPVSWRTTLADRYKIRPVLRQMVGNFDNQFLRSPVISGPFVVRMFERDGWLGWSCPFYRRK